MRYFVILFLFNITLAYSQSSKPYWVFIQKDSSNLQSTETAKRIQSTLSSLGFEKRYISRWLNAISGTCNDSTAARISKLSYVKQVSPVGFYKQTRSLQKTALQKLSKSMNSLYGQSYYPLQLIQVTTLDALQVINRSDAGKGIRIALFDSGFNLNHEVFAHFDESTIIGKRDYVAHMINPSIPFDTTVADDSLDYPGQQNHGTSVLSLIAGWNPGYFMGIAPFAKFALVKTERTRDLAGHESETVDEEDAWTHALEWVVDSVGVDIITTSLGYRYDFTDGHGDSAGGTAYSLSKMNGDSLLITQMADMAAEKGVVVFASVGNEGDYGLSSLSAPADGDSVIAVGATSPFGALWPSTSYGPTADGRAKPDLSAPGNNITTAEADAPTSYSVGSGTSYAAPIAAGACALLLQLVDSLRGHPWEVMERLKTTAYFPSSISEASRQDPRFGTGIINIYNAYFNLKLQTPFKPLELCIAPQPAREKRQLQFIFSIPAEIGLYPESMELRIRIYTLSGQLVRNINKKMPEIIPGTNKILWDLTNNSNGQIGQGIYLAKMHYSDNLRVREWRQKIAVVQ